MEKKFFFSHPAKEKPGTSPPLRLVFSSVPGQVPFKVVILTALGTTGGQTGGRYTEEGGGHGEPHAPGLREPLLGRVHSRIPGASAASPPSYAQPRGSAPSPPATSQRQRPARFFGGWGPDDPKRMNQRRPGARRGHRLRCTGLTDGQDERRRRPRAVSVPALEMRCTHAVQCRSFQDPLSIPGVCVGGGGGGALRGAAGSSVVAVHLLLRRDSGRALAVTLRPAGVGLASRVTAARDTARPPRQGPGRSPEVSPQFQRPQAHC